MMRPNGSVLYYLSKKDERIDKKEKGVVWEELGVLDLYMFPARDSKCVHSTNMR